jgi:hypothetical protein
LTIILTFCFGVFVGGFLSIVVIREAIPLRDHYLMIGIISAAGSIVVLVLIGWYFRVIKICRTAFGDKGGGVINSLLSFLVVSTALMFMVIVGIFYAAIA